MRDQHERLLGWTDEKFGTIRDEHGWLVSLKQRGCRPAVKTKAVTPANLEEEMSQAVEQWLAARTTFRNGAAEVLTAYCQADRRLLAAFAAGSHVDNPRLLAQSYEDFQRILIASQIVARRNLSFLSLQTA